MPQAAPAQTASSTFHAGHGVAAAIVLGLVIAFGLHLAGFRFVVAAGFGR